MRHQQRRGIVLQQCVHPIETEFQNRNCGRTDQKQKTALIIYNYLGVNETYRLNIIATTREDNSVFPDWLNKKRTFPIRNWRTKTRAASRADKM
jgi:hypothetical protein